MNKKCINCDKEMTEAWLNTGAGTFLVEEKNKLFKSKTSSVSVMVCSNCGHIELIADNAEIFQK